MKKIFVVTAMFISSQLSAQQQEVRDTSRVMDEVTLTANKFSVKTTETGKVVTVITRQQIEHAGSRDLAQVVAEMGGVFINGFNSNPGKEKNIYLRGAKVEYTLITIDGVPVYDASGVGSYFDIRNISIDNVERIEILKGSQSTLYGSDAIAGVVNIITRKHTGKPFSIGAVANYGSFNTFRGSVNVGGRKDRFDFSIGYGHLSTEGFSEAKPPATSTGKFEKDGYRQNNLQANLGWKLSEAVSVQPFFRFSKFSGDLDVDAFTDETDFTNKNTNVQAGVRNLISVGRSQINMLYQFVNSDRKYLDDSGYVSTHAFYKYNRDEYDSREHFAEAFVVHPFQSFRLTAGLDVRSSNTDHFSIQKNVFSPVAEQSSFSGDSVRHNQWGVYAALNFFKNDFSIEGGTRFNHHSEYGGNFAFNINPSYLLNKRVKVFANLSSGYKVPGLYQLFSIYGNRELQPETSVNMEGGMQFFSRNQKSNVRALFFKRDVKDVIAFFMNPSTFRFYYVNQDRQDDHGFEIDATLRLGDKLDLRALYNYVTGEITTKQSGKDTTFFNLLRRPKGTFTFFAGSQLTKSFYMNLQFNATGERKDVYFDPVTFQSSNIALRPYVLANISAEFAAAKNLKLFADLRNILDKEYSDIYGYNTAGFNVHGGLRLSL